MATAQITGLKWKMPNHFVKFTQHWPTGTGVCNVATSSWHKSAGTAGPKRSKEDCLPSGWVSREKKYVSGLPESIHDTISKLFALVAPQLKYSNPTKEFKSRYDVVDSVTGHKTGVSPACLSRRIKIGSRETPLSFLSLYCCPGRLHQAPWAQ